MRPLRIREEPLDTIPVDSMRAILHYEQVISDFPLLSAATKDCTARSHEDAVAENFMAFGESVAVVAFAHEELGCRGGSHSGVCLVEGRCGGHY
jgi:hypothetical protein